MRQFFFDNNYFNTLAMQMLKILVSFSLGFTVRGDWDRPSSTGCAITISRDITNPQPLLLRPEGVVGNDIFKYPQDTDVISFPEGRSTELACLGGNLCIDEVSIGIVFANVTCSSGTRFVILNEIVPFSHISCTRYPVHMARFTGKVCLSRYSEIEIGFQIKANFVRLFTVCFDEIVQTTVYTEMQLTPVVEARQSGVPRPSWIEDDFYDLGQESLNTLYTRNRQRITINTLLGLPAHSTKYVHKTNSFYIAKGHLVPMANFVFGAHQRATFYFVNAAPQWQVFNAGNWMVFERNYRNFVVKNGLNVTVYTGTYGVSTLPHAVTGEDTELFLFVDDDDDEEAIPVPALYWAVLYEPYTKAGTVFIGVNNPYIEDEDVDKYVICPDVCDQIDWLTWSPTVIEKGYAYCCDVEDFRRVVDVLPDFKVTHLLK